ncbi:sugar phosphate isomerase/epimerase family protein [Paenibacillus gansuensis]|uniref:Sugar phosphate isomerase/epimerase family protein n=1 Tax=Paenibacillus gansuensis TaxID=306542 RepID=A0ABW5PI86_9BACL
MIKGLTNAGIDFVGSLKDFVQLAAANGFGSVDADGGQIERWIAEEGAEQVNAYLAEKGVIIGAIGLYPDWRGTDAKFQAGLPRLVNDAAAAAAVGCKSCCTYILPATDLDSAHFMALAVSRLRTCARLLGAYGISLALEFVGPHHLRTAWKNPFIWNTEQTLALIDAIGEPNVGLLYDSFHWYTNGGTLDDILKLRADQIVHAHLNDARDVPVEDVLDNDRLFPGDGVIDLAAFLQGLQQIGYKGPVAQELLTREPIPGTPQEKAARSGEAYRSVYRAAGLDA